MEEDSGMIFVNEVNEFTGECRVTKFTPKRAVAGMRSLVNGKARKATEYLVTKLRLLAILRVSLGLKQAFVLVLLPGI